MIFLNNCRFPYMFLNFPVPAAPVQPPRPVCQPPLQKKAKFFTVFQAAPLGSLKSVVADWGPNGVSKVRQQIRWGCLGGIIKISYFRIYIVLVVFFFNLLCFFELFLVFQLKKLFLSFWSSRGPSPLYAPVES